MTISQDLRIRLVRKVATGMSCWQAARHFDVRVSSAIRLGKQYKTEVSMRAPKSTIDARLTSGCEDGISASKKPHTERFYFHLVFQQKR